MNYVLLRAVRSRSTSDIRISDLCPSSSCLLRCLEVPCICLQAVNACSSGNSSSLKEWCGIVSVAAVGKQDDDRLSFAFLALRHFQSRKQSCT